MRRRLVVCSPSCVYSSSLCSERALIVLSVHISCPKIFVARVSFLRDAKDEMRSQDL